jgi:purine-binding chemotaxis protein CheW
MDELISFTLDDTRYAVAGSRVIEVAARVLVTPLPDAPSPIVGVFSHHGVPMAAVDLRARLGHPRRPPARDDHFLLVRSARRAVALVVDRVLAMERVAPELVRTLPAPDKHIAAVVTHPEGVILIEDLDAVLSLDEERAIDEGVAALSAEGAGT